MHSAPVTAPSLPHRHLRWLSAPLAAALLAGAPAWAAGTDVVAARLKRQAQAWDKAIVEKDLAVLASNMCDDFRMIGRSGDVDNREAFLRDIMSPDLEIDPYTVEDLDVRRYRDTALLTGRTRVTGRYAGAPFSMHFRYTDVWVRFSTGWKLCSVQTTPMPK